MYNTVNPERGVVVRWVTEYTRRSVCRVDLIWFGIFIVLVVEIAQITAPVGFNLFVVQGLTGHNILHVARSVTPFFFVLCLGVLIITIFPEIATWLPKTMFSAR
jgi:C4-dicarboxylate transporter DctM subunit